MAATQTFGEARVRYLQRAALKSHHTIESYRRAIDLFFRFLSDNSETLDVPLRHRIQVTVEQTPLSALTADDAPIFLYFAQWMLAPGSGTQNDRRPYKLTTVELRVSGILNWFQFIDDHNWLPPSFPFAKARRIIRDELRGHARQTRPPQPPEHIEEIIYFYDNVPRPPRLNQPDVDPDRIRRWELTRLRNRALVRTLAETGGRISEVLSLNLADFPERYMKPDSVRRVEIRGKGGHAYYLRFHDSLPAIRDYIEARGANLRAITGQVPLFVSHDRRFDGTRMSRVVAWRVVQHAARALGLGRISPHDFRHWRATQLINAGYALDVVQEYLGHRSVETTRAYYAHTDPLRVDDAARNMGLPRPRQE